MRHADDIFEYLAAQPLKTYEKARLPPGTGVPPSEYIRGLIRQDKERRLANLEQELPPP